MLTQSSVSNFDKLMIEKKTQYNNNILVLFEKKFRLLKWKTGSLNIM